MKLEGFTLVMSKLIKFLSLLNPLELSSDYFSQLCWPWVINKDQLFGFMVLDHPLG
jgi:hypothetical protein